MAKRPQQPFMPRIVLIPRHLVPSANQVKPLSVENNESTKFERAQSLSQKEPVSSFDSKSSNVHDNTQTTRITTISDIEHNSSSSIISKESQKENLGQQKKIYERFQDWWTGLTKRNQICLKIILISLIVLILCTAIIIPPVLVLVVFKSNIQTSFTNITASTCSATTCIGGETTLSLSNTRIYPFDGSYSDAISFATGIAFGSPGTSCPEYIGANCLEINLSTTQQYVQIPEINLSSQSFTIEAWLRYSGSNSNDSGIFGQCDLNDICLLISVRFRRIVISFDSMNSTNRTLTGSTIIPTGRWFHFAFVYDAVLYQQRIYVEGEIDAVSKDIVTPFQGVTTGSTTTIGRARSSAYGYTFFVGRIDHFVITRGIARSNCEIYNDASLVAYFPFDSTGISQDYSINLLNGVGSGYTVLSQGHISQAIYFHSSSSYFQTECFTDLANNNPPFTFSLWVNPVSATSGGCLIHISDLQSGNGSNCFDLLALSSTGALVVQLLNSSSAIVDLLGPVIPDNTWTHIAVVYGSTNGLRLFVDGELSVTTLSTGTLNIYSYSDPQYVTIGNNNPYGLSGTPSCRTGTSSFVSGSYIGAVDDFRYYNRELNNDEICVLSQM